MIYNVITCQMRRLRTGVGGGVDADRSLSGALCPPSLGDKTDTNRGYPWRFGRGWGDISAADEGTILVGFTGKTRFSVWHCDRAGWRMLGCRRGGDELGETERIADGISGDATNDRALAGFPRWFRAIWNNAVQYIDCSKIWRDSWSRAHN